MTSEQTSEDAVRLSAVLLELAGSFRLEEGQLAMPDPVFDRWKARVTGLPRPELLSMQLVAMAMKLWQMNPEAADLAIVQLSELALPLFYIGAPPPEPDAAEDPTPAAGGAPQPDGAGDKAQGRAERRRQRRNRKRGAP